MSAPPVAIPYEKQADPQIHRGCGAACLSMVYKSFGKEVPQADIWPLIAKANRFGSIASTSHLMALHALSQGFSAMAIQARHPVQVLRLCRDAGIRAILNQRPRPDVATGHYTVLVDIDDKTVVVHDPALGPGRRMSHAELMQLWQPQSSASEITGNVVIAIAADPVAIPACEFCHTAIPPKVDCPKCKKAVGLSPAAALGCIRDGCIARMWNYVACPSCDFMWSFNDAGTSTGDVPRAAAAEADSNMALPDLAKAFAELDKFCAHVLSIPAAANHPDLKAQIDFMQASKEPIRLAQIAELTAMKARLDQITAAHEESTKKAEADRKKQEELNAPPPPLDGTALGNALLKNLGFK
ncbi:MAG: cysteine peptidase family C39 domain-containing protein [Bryobacteraceae bacterium]